MLILTEELARQNHEETKLGLMNQFNQELEKILNQNQNVDRYWVLGKVRFPPEYDGKYAKIFLEACAEKPHLIKEAFLYEVDNRKGVKTLLWVMHPGDKLTLPTLGKTVSVGP
jgi:hypothetical protein